MSLSNVIPDSLPPNLVLFGLFTYYNIIPLRTILA